MAWFDFISLNARIAAHGLPGIGWTTLSGGGTTTMLSTDRCFNCISVPAADRQIDLVAANSLPAGTTVWFVNSDGSCSISKTIIINPGTDTINGSASDRVINAAYGSAAITTNGTEWVLS